MKVATTSDSPVVERSEQGGEPLLRLEGVCKSFGALRAVDDIALTVPRGSIQGIAGPNGAGKTTLFNVITGVPFGADRGEIRFRGRDIASAPGHVRCRMGMARTFQADAAFRSLSVEQTLELGLVFGSRRPKSQRRGRIDELLEQFELGDHRAQTVNDLPLFVKKLVVIASALATDPELLLLDEPAAGLSRPEVAELAEIVRSINAAGVTVLLIEHILPFLLGISDRVLIMNYGARLAEGTPQEIVGNPDVIEAYLGERGKKLAAAQAEGR